jgi:hypothetical protein
MVKAFETWYNIDCEQLQQQIGDTRQNLTIRESRPTVMNHEEDELLTPEDQTITDDYQPEDWKENNGTATWTTALFDTVYGVLFSLEFAISSAESFIATTEFVQEWLAGNYFQSGYFFGVGATNTFFIWYNIFKTYADTLIAANDAATNPEGEEVGDEDHSSTDATE